MIDLATFIDAHLDEDLNLTDAIRSLLALAVEADEVAAGTRMTEWSPRRRGQRSREEQVGLDARAQAFATVLRALGSGLDATPGYREEWLPTEDALAAIPLRRLA